MERKQPLTDTVAVYCGTHLDCVFLQSVLGGSGMRAFIETLSMGKFDGVDARLYVDRTGLERAAPIIEDFKERGHNLSVDTASED